MSSGSESESVLDEIDDGTDLSLSTGEESLSEGSQELSDNEELEGNSSISFSQENTELHESTGSTGSQSISQDHLENGHTNGNDSIADSLQHSFTDNIVSLQENDKAVRSTVNSTVKTLKHVTNFKQILTSKSSQNRDRPTQDAKHNLNKSSPSSSTTNTNRQPISSKSNKSVKPSEVSKLSTNSQKAQFAKNRPSIHRIAKHLGTNVCPKNENPRDQKGWNKVKDSVQSAHRTATHSASYHKSRRHQG